MEPNNPTDPWELRVPPAARARCRKVVRNIYALDFDEKYRVMVMHEGQKRSGTVRTKEEALQMREQFYADLGKDDLNLIREGM